MTFERWQLLRRKMKRIAIYSIILTLGILNSGCVNVSKTNREDFNFFYERFHEDKDFQLSRIKFPLPGINTDEMSLDDSIYFWTKENWEFHYKFEDTANYYLKTKKRKNVRIEEISSKIPGFIVHRKFELIDNKWYLTYYENVNL